MAKGKSIKSQRKERLREAQNGMWERKRALEREPYPYDKEGNWIVSPNEPERWTNAHADWLWRKGLEKGCLLIHAQDAITDEEFDNLKSMIWSQDASNARLVVQILKSKTLI